MNARVDGRRLRVAMLVHAYYEHDARVRRYAESLVADGHSVEVFALRAPGRARSERLAGVLVRRLPLRRRRGGLLRYLYEYGVFFALAAAALARRSLARRYDLVHVHNMPDFLVFAALVPKLRGARVLLDVHDLMPEVWASKFHRGLAHPAVFPIRIQEAVSQRAADGLVFATEIFRRLAARRNALDRGRTLVVLNAPDLGLFDVRRHPPRGPEDPQEFRILYLGTISQRHGVEHLIRVLPLLRGRIPKPRLHVHPKLDEGEGEPLRALERLARELGVADLLEIRPSVPLERVPEIMSRASVGVFTPTKDVHIDIALSLKIPEFVAMELPIVTLRTRIMESLFRPDEVLFYEEGDLDGLARALVRVHEDPGAARAMALRARRFLEEHSWEHEYAAYRRFVERLIAERDGSPAAAGPG